MAALAWVVHDKIKEYEGNKVVNYDTDAFKMILCLSASNIATTSIDALSTVTNEHANANGYTTGGKAITNPSWVESAGVVTFDCDDVVWTASGGSIVAKFAAIYDDTVASPVVDPVVCHSQMDSASPGADITTTTGNTLTVGINASGVFTKT